MINLKHFIAENTTDHWKVYQHYVGIFFLYYKNGTIWFWNQINFFKWVQRWKKYPYFTFDRVWKILDHFCARSRKFSVSPNRRKSCYLMTISFTLALYAPYLLCVIACNCASYCSHICIHWVVTYSLTWSRYTQFQQIMKHYRHKE